MKLNAIFLLLALAGADAHADDVALITPGAALPPNNAVEHFWKNHNSPSFFFRVHPVVLNEVAFGADVVTVVVEGKEYRFVGSILPAPALSTTWRGYESLPGREREDLSFITLRKDPSGVVGGCLYLTPGRRFDIDRPAGLSSTVLIETTAR